MGDGAPERLVVGYVPQSRMITKSEESFCLMSTEGRLLIRNGDRGRKRKKE